MVKNIISLVLLLISAFLSFKHGFDSLNSGNNPESSAAMSGLGINKNYLPVLGAVSIIIGLLLLLPKTFFVGNLLNAISIMIILALALNVGNVRLALMEIPFIVMPLVMIWLKYPFKDLM